jgi:primosomal protein N'
MARFIVRDQNFDNASGRAESLASRLRSEATQGVIVSPSAACVLPRIADKYRFDVTVIAPTSQELQKFLQNARKTVTAGRELAIDIDPISML